MLCEVILGIGTAFGAWQSPITAQMCASSGVGLSEVRVSKHCLYWRESRPDEGGRGVLMGARLEALEMPFEVLGGRQSVHTRVHEYGGAPFALVGGEAVVFSEATSQRLWRGGLHDGKVEALSPDVEGQVLRYADGVADPSGRYLYSVREDHRGGGKFPDNALVVFDLDGGQQEGRVVACGQDFYAAPRVSPDGKKMAWLSWNLPNMPWDGTELWVGDLAADGEVVGARRVAGGSGESIFQPEWSPGGTLYCVSDRSGWWNLYRVGGRGLISVCPKEAEFGMPMWVFGLSTYAFIDEDTMVAAYSHQGKVHLALICCSTGKMERLDLPYTQIGYVRATSDAVFFVGGAAHLPSAVVRYDLREGAVSVVRQPNTLAVPTHFLSTPQPIEFSTEGGKMAFGLFYPPRQLEGSLPEGKPPLIVRAHGGPVGQATSGLDLSIQYWTSRGFAFVDVNYGGSSGYGREYRERLKGQWGVVDVQDCVHAARFLADGGLVDGSRWVIRGGSAGGFTALSALAFTQEFSCGASYYGVSDLEALARDTHKFEGGDLENLVGAYPEKKALYEARSPLYHAESISVPVIFLQGGLDLVVPPNQSEAMWKALKGNDVYTEYVLFPEERHGFRGAKAMAEALEREYAFYCRVLRLGGAS